MTNSEKIQYLYKEKGYSIQDASRKVKYDTLIEDINKEPISRSLTDLLKRILDSKK